MLVQLKIKHIAIIDECTIEFGHGFNVLTGETGAGKSIIIDSLNFALGARADKSLIMAGKDSASVSAVFDTTGIDNVGELKELLGFDDVDTLVLSRTMTVAGKNECRINGELTSLAVLRKITSLLVDIYGQHDSVELLDAHNHIDILDSVHIKAVEPSKLKIVELLEQIKLIDEQISELGGIGSDRERNIDILKYQINEIDLSNLQLNEDELLESKLNKLKNSEKIAELLKSSVDMLDGNYSVVNTLKFAANNINSLSEYDEQFDSLEKRIQSAKYELEDIIDTLNKELNAVNYSEDEINSIIDRLELIKDLSRKYGKTIDDILSFREKAKEKLDMLLNAEESIAKLTTKKEEFVKALKVEAEKLTQIRKEIASKLSSRVVSELKVLGMKNAKFEVLFDESPKDFMSVITPNGADKLEFMFSANLGVPLAPLSKIISGGEMSRFMLAFKSVTGGEGKTYVFDEIDAGIGGETATIVAVKIAQIAKNSQVLCVTHLAQIAAFGDVNFLIVKTEKDKTTTRVELLDENSKLDEITRMIGSVNNKEYAYKHAKEIVAEAKQIRLNN